MLITALTVATMLSAVQVAPAINVDSVARPTSGIVADDRTTASDHIDAARRALKSGDFDGARREYVIAAALDRDDGKLPVDATFGLASVQFARNMSREAAATMDRLAADALAIGDYDTEARALVDAIWLNIDAGQRTQARTDGLRLQALLKERSLSPSVLKQVGERFR
jgi:hypothetical protein